MIEWEDFKEPCCVVVPIYRESIVFFEQASLIQLVRVLGNKYDICLVCPFGLDLTPYTSMVPDYRFRVKRFSKGFFDGLQGYNQLCKRFEFYEAFMDYTYMLIYQLDCWIFDDNLDYFMSLGYDYIGAPWIRIEDNQLKSMSCGNGGFSLRRTDKFIEVCKEYREKADDESVPEDVFFSTGCDGKIKVCTVEDGRAFSFEVGPSLMFKMNDQKLPMGCHKPYLFEFKSFWKNYIKF